MTTVEYDRAVIDQYATGLYAQANWIAVAWTIVGVVVGALLLPTVWGMLIGIVPYQLSNPMNGLAALMPLVGAGLGGYVGYKYGESRFFSEADGAIGALPCANREQHGESSKIAGNILRYVR